MFLHPHVPAVVLLLSIVASAQVVYDPAEGNLPDQHGFTLFETGLGHAPPALVGSELRMGPTIVNGVQGYRAWVPEIDFDMDTVAVGAELKVVSSPFASFPGNCLRGGFGLFIQDRLGRVAVLNISDQNVFIQIGDCGVSAPIAMDTTSSFRHYSLKISAGVASLLVDGGTVVSIGVDVAPPLTLKNLISFGNHTLATNSEVLLRSFAYTTFRGLLADGDTISLATGGTQQIFLDGGSGNAFAFFFLLGSVSGTSPGVTTPAGTLPLVRDAYFDFTATNPNTVPLTNSLGLLNGMGRALSLFTLPAGLPANLAGVALHHAFFVLNPASPGFVSFVSGAIPVELAP